MNKKTYKEWDRAEGCFGSGVSGEFWPLLNSPERYEAAYEALSDEESRQIFEWRLKVRLAMPFVMRWEDAYPAPKAPGLEGITLDGEEAAFCKGCNSGQYILNPYCLPEPGDVVLDLGAFLGDSAVAFSRLVGPTGAVYSFEALKAQYSMLKKNLKRFNCTNTKPVFNAAWKSNERLCISSNRGSSSIGSGTDSVMGIRIDDFVRENRIERIDFIKMDIEGAEQEALDGCRQTLKLYRPKLALSAYHKPEDLYLLMEMVTDIGGDYQFFLRHYDPAGFNDTVLYGVPQ